MADSPASLTVLDEALPAHLHGTAEAARQFIRDRHAASTRRAYASDVMVFQRWAEERAVDPFPATPQTVVLFLTDEATRGIKAATLVRRLSAIRYLHREANLASPTEAEIVKATFAGIRRVIGIAQRKVSPATADRVVAMLATCDDSLQGKRDRALLALGFGGAFRRSELVALKVADLTPTDEGIRVLVRSSKTDQEGAGVVVPVLDGARLRVKVALADWLEAAGIAEGPVFVRLSRGNKARRVALTDRSVADIIKKRALHAGLDPALFSGHSLRSGFVTSGAASGASLFKIMDVSRHKKVDTLRGYVRMAEQFKDHAGAAFM